jgi:hypothetical protein
MRHETQTIITGNNPSIETQYSAFIFSSCYFEEDDSSPECQRK